MNLLLEKIEKSKMAISKLEVSSKEIEEVIHLINKVTEQTHVLALNVTIEAARAGVIGKGLSVLAVEAKELANQAVIVKNRIIQKVNLLQKNTSNVVHAIEEISESTKQEFL